MSLFPDFEGLYFDDTQVHVLSSLIKTFFRELPEPLVTYELYENFLNVSGKAFFSYISNCSEVKETAERLRCLSVMVELLPRSNKNLLERLMYHLARVAHQVRAVHKIAFIIFRNR